MRYLLSLIPAVLAIAGNLLGGWWTLAATAFFALLVLPDWLFKSPTTDSGDDHLPDLVLLAHAVLQTFVTFTLVEGVHSGRLVSFFATNAILSTGLTAGASGLVAAHELIHRREKWMQRAGLWLLFLNRYTHYFIEHLQGHHRNVGLDCDPTTAHRGESFYRFLWRIVPQQFLTALRIEQRRLEATGRAGLGWRNFVVTFTALEWVFLGALYFTVGPAAAAAFFGSTLVARLFWESGSYVQHYGLTRTTGERVDEAHSWQCNSAVSRAMLLEIVRHSDHHCHVGKSFPALASCSRSPELPAGSFGLFFFVLIPPAWFAIAHSRLAAWHGTKSPGF